MPFFSLLTNGPSIEVVFKYILDSSNSFILLQLLGYMDISSAIISPNASIFITEFSPFGSLLDINNRIRQSTTKVN